MAPSLQQAIDVAREKAYVILDGTILRIDQVAMSSDRNRPFYPGCEDRSAPPRNAETIEGAQHPDRDAQFGYLNDHAKAYQAAGDPVVSVDTKKKEPAPRGAGGDPEYPTGTGSSINL